MAKFISTAELLRRKNNKNEDNTTDDNGFRSTAELVGINDDFRETVAKRKTQLSQSKRSTPEQNYPAQDNSFFGKVNAAVYNSYAQRQAEQTNALHELNLPDNPSYTQIQKTITSQEQQKSAAARRGRDTSAYDKAIEMLKGYADSNYGFDSQTSSADREALYTDKKRELEQLKNEEKETDKTRPVDYYSKDDIATILKSRGASYDYTPEENADFFVKYRQHIIPHGNDDKDENARRYQGLLAIIEQSNKELPNEKIAELQSKQSAIQDELRYYEKNKQSLENLEKTPEELVKDIDSEPFDYTNVEDVKGALGAGSDADAEFFVKYRQHIIPHGNDDNDENARKYQRLLEAVNLTAKSQGARKMYSQGEEVAAVSKSGQTMNYRDLLTHKVARNREADLTVSQEEAGNILKSLGTGSRDLTQLPMLTDKEQKAAGWYSNFKNGYHSYTYKGDVENGEVEDKSAVFSAIVTDSKGNVVRVLSPSEMEEYAQKALSTGDDPLKLQATETYAGFMGTSLAVENAKRINRLSERYFNNTDLESVVDAAISGDKYAQSNAEQYGLDVDEIRHYRYITDTQKQKQQASRDYAEWSAENVGTGALATGANILASPLKAAEFVINLGESWDNNIKANRSGGISSYRLPANYDDFVTSMTNESTEQITEGIRNSIKGNGDSAVLNWLGDVTANTYGGVASSAQSALTGLTARAIFGPGAGEVVALTVMSGEAANDAFNEVIDNGGTTSQAIMYGIASGTNEALFEKVSLDHLINVKDVIGKEGIKDIFLSALKQGGIEASEEAFTELANRFADDVINTDKSEYNRNVQKYIDEGYSDEEAKSKANLDFAGQVMASAWGGFVGGGFSTGTKVVSNTVANAVQQKAETRQAGAAIADAKNIPALIEQANAVEGSEKITTQAAKVKALYDKNGGEKITGSLKKEAGTLYNMLRERDYSEINSASNTLQTTVRDKVIAATGTENTVAESAIIKSEITGDQLTEEEQAAINTPEIQTAIQELRESGELNNAVASVDNALSNYAKTTNLRTERTDEDLFTSNDDGKTYVKGSDKPINIMSIASVGADDITMRTDDGETVSAKDIDFPNSDTAAVLAGLIDIQKSVGTKMSSDVANVVMTAANIGINNGTYSDNIGALVNDVRNIYQDAYWHTGTDTPAILTQGDAQAIAKVAQAEVRAASETPTIKKPKKRGAVVFEDGVKRSDYKDNSRRGVSIDLIENLAQATGITFHFYKSEVNQSGKRVSRAVNAKLGTSGTNAPNGFYQNGEIWIDVNAGTNGEGLILFTASHELVHFIKEGSPADFNALAEFLMDKYGDKKKNVHNYIQAEMRRNHSLTPNEAYEEVVARMCESFLTDIHLSDKAAELYKKNRSLAEKIRDWLSKFRDRIATWYKGVSQNSQYASDGQAIAQKFNKAYDLYIQGIRNASENMRNAKQSTKNGKVKHSFVGRNATTADIMTLEEAKQMEDEGESSEDIRKKTGWFKGLDGKWRFEIDDSAMKIKTENLQRDFAFMYLPQLIDHPQLFKAYPQLKRAVVKFENLSGNKDGSFNASNSTITLNADLKNNSDVLSNTLVHEIQHAIQHLEGFAKGANPQYWKNALESRDTDIRTKGQKRIASVLWDEYNSIRQDNPDFVEEMNEWYNSRPEIPRARIDLKTLKRTEPEPQEWVDYDNKREELINKYGFQKVSDYTELRYRLDQSLKEYDPDLVTPDSLYYMTAGEVEARDSERRRDFSEMQRKNTRPDVDREDVVFRDGDDESVRYDLRKDVNGNTFVDVDPSIYDETDGESVAQVIAKIISDRFHNLIETNGQQIRINATTNAEWRRSEDATKLKRKQPSVYDDKMKAIGNADEILTAAQNWIGEQKVHNTDNGIVEYARGNVMYRVGQNGYIADVLVGTKKDNSTVLYDLVDIHEIKIAEAPVSKAGNSRLSSQRTSTTDRVSQIDNNVKYDSRDDDYMSAVERGDMKTAQRMVDEAAKAAGYTIKAYHGTSNDFTVFDKERVGQGTDQFGAGFYFATDKSAAKHYGKRVISARLNIDNPIRINRTLDGGDLFDIELTAKQAYEIIKQHPLIMDEEESPLGDWFEAYWNDGVQDWMIQELAYSFPNIGLLDSDLFRNYPNELHEAIRDVIGYDGVEVTFDNTKEKFYVAWFDNQMKSAESVTYDDNGNIIPLSQRFDTSQQDIRYDSRVKFDDWAEMLSWDDDVPSEDASDTELIRHHLVTHNEAIGEILNRTRDMKLSPEEMRRNIKAVLSEYGFNRQSAQNISRAVEDVITVIEAGIDMSGDDILHDIGDAVYNELLDGKYYEEGVKERYDELIDLLSSYKKNGTKFYLTDRQLSNLKEIGMTFAEFRAWAARKENGMLQIVKDKNLRGATRLNLEDLEYFRDVFNLDNDSDWNWDSMTDEAPRYLFEGIDNLKKQMEINADEYFRGETDEVANRITAAIIADVVEKKYMSANGGKSNLFVKNAVNRAVEQAVSEQQKIADERVLAETERSRQYVEETIATLRAERDAAIQEQKKKDNERIAEFKRKQRERTERLVKQEKDKRTEQRKTEHDRRKRTELRGKIRRLKESFDRRLTKPKEGQYIPRELISQTIAILNAIDLDSYRSTRLTEKIKGLYAEYEKLKNNSETYAIYDPVMSSIIENLSDTVGDTSIMQMSLNQLGTVYQSLRSLDEVIRNSVRMVDSEFKQTAHAVGREWIAEINQVKGHKRNPIRDYNYSMLRADVMFNRIAGWKKNSISSRLCEMLNNGQLRMTQLEMEFSMIFDDLMTDYKQLHSLSDTKNLVDIGLKDQSGNTVKITRGMMLSLYMHLLNEDNARHVMGGGLTVPDMKSYYRGDMSNAYGNGQTSVRADVDYSRYVQGLKSAIEEILTPYEMAWIDAAAEFFDVASKNAINETTMTLYHFNKATVNNYFPIHTDPDYRAASFDDIRRDMSLENSGFMKERVHASNPILLEDITDVINNQIQMVAKYCGMTIAIKNFEKVYGTTTREFESSVQKALKTKFSGSATSYIDNLLTDLTSGRTVSDKLTKFNNRLGKVRGNLAQATLTLNPSVAFSQAASYPTAAAVIGWKPLMKAIAVGGKNGHPFSRADKTAIADVSPLLWKRQQGYSTVEIGDLKNKRVSKHKTMNKLKKAFAWIEFFDGATVGRLYTACEYYVDENYKELKKGSEEYKEKVAETYNRVIERTQPNYTTMQRPDILRNPNEIVKSLTMFMTQRLQNFNILYDAIGEYSRTHSDLKKGLNGVTAEDNRQARVKLWRAVSSQLAAAMTIVAMKTLVNFALYNIKRYKDDDDELTAENLWWGILDNFADTILGNVLFGSDVYSLFKNKVFKTPYYGLSMSGVDSIKGVLDAFTDLDFSDLTLDDAHKLILSGCQLFGIPLKNGEKIGTAAYYYIKDGVEGTMGEYEQDVNRTAKQNMHRIELNYLNGDTEKARDIHSSMYDDKVNDGIAKGETKQDAEKKAKSYMRGRYTATYKERYVEAIKNNDASTVNDIRNILRFSGVYEDLDKTLEGWTK